MKLLSRLKQSGDPVKDRKLVRNLCGDCKKFVSKFHRRWDWDKIPDVYIGDGAECKKCMVYYEVYKGSVFAMPMMTKKELEKMEPGDGCG